MISPTDFTRGFALLMDRFGRKLGEPTIAEYHRILVSELDTDAFNRAAAAIFRHDDFFPSPQRFIDAATGGSSKELAEAAWSQVVTWAQRGEYPPLETLPDGIRRGLRAAPMREVQYADSEAKLARLRRDFTAAHQSEPELTRAT